MGLFEGVILIIITVMAYRSWTNMSIMFRVLFVCAILSGAGALIYRLSGEEIIAFDSVRLTVSKSFHGWERKSEYFVNECRELEWMQGAEDVPDRLQLKIGQKTVGFGENLTEDQAMQIFSSLQEYLPDVSRQLCSYSSSKSHFITLGLSRL